MAYHSKNPKFNSSIFADQGVASVDNAPSSSNRLVNRNSRLYIKDASGNETEVVSGASAEINYIKNPSGNNGTTGWSQVGDLDIARTTTAGDLPREQSTPTGLKITADANTQSTADYVYYDFTLDDIDASSDLRIEFSKKITGSYVSGDLAVIIAAQSDRTTAIATPSTTAIDDTDGTFSATFTSTATTAISLVIRATTDMATNAGITISDVIVGPGRGLVYDEATTTTLGLVKKKKYEKFAVAGPDKTAAGTIATFSGLTTGQTYRVTAQVHLQISSDDDVSCRIVHDSTPMAQFRVRDTSTGQTQAVCGSCQTIFAATASTVTLDAVSASANGLVLCNGDFTETWWMIEELDDYEVTTDF